MNTGIILTLIVIGGVVCGEVLSCDSCGRECQAACGTRQFRACCFNYLRKRTAPSEAGPVDPSLRLELWLARSRALPSRNVFAMREYAKLKAEDLNMAKQTMNNDANDYNFESTM